MFSDNIKNMNDGGEKISEESYEYIKTHENEVIRRFAGNYEDFGEGRVTVLMAGAPGSGKTEFSRCLVREQFGEDSRLIVRIDPDEIRTWLPTYIKGKAELFNTATNKAVEILVDHCYDKKHDKSFLLDGTLSNLEVAKRNIDRALKRNRKVQIFFVYKDPIAAWGFTQKREKVEGRNIPIEEFVNQYFASMANINSLKAEYGKNVQVDLVRLETENKQPKMDDYKFEFNVTNIDGYVQKKYSKKNLMRMLCGDI